MPLPFPVADYGLRLNPETVLSREMILSMKMPSLALDWEGLLLYTRGGGEGIFGRPDEVTEKSLDRHHLTYGPSPPCDLKLRSRRPSSASARSRPRILGLDTAMRWMASEKITARDRAVLWRQ